MKKLILALIGLTIISCSSCKKSTTTEPSPFGPETDMITLSFSPYNMEPIRDDISAVVNRLDVWIIDGEDVYDYHQEKNTATSFGTFHIHYLLPYGSVIFLFLLSRKETIVITKQKRMGKTILLYRQAHPGYLFRTFHYHSWNIYHH